MKSSTFPCRASLMRSGVAAAACMLLSACDGQPQPRTAGNVAIATAAAQQVDLVVPPAAISGAMAPIDEAFALHAHSAALTQIEASQWVLKNTRDAAVREYALRLTREHAQSRKALERVASARGLKLPASPTGRHLDLLTKLKGVVAADLDDAFVRRVGIDAHKEAVTLFERHLEAGKDAELKRHAEQMLPALRAHMAAAQKLLDAASAR